LKIKIAIGRVKGAAADGVVKDSLQRRGRGATPFARLWSKSSWERWMECGLTDRITIRHWVVHWIRYRRTRHWDTSSDGSSGLVLRVDSGGRLESEDSEEGWS